MTVRQLDASDERALRRWLLQQEDADFAMHRQLRDYFLAPTTGFGTAVYETAGGWSAGIFFSRYNQKAYIHQYHGDHTLLPTFVEWLAQNSVQAFFRDGFEPQEEGWTLVLPVTPGYVVDHPAYNGVFSRVAPRFKGAVFEYQPPLQER